MESNKYSPNEISFIIKCSARLQPIDAIVAGFNKLMAGDKKITGATVQEIQSHYAKRIAREAEIYLKNVEGNPFAHPRLVLDMFLEIYNESREAKPVFKGRDATGEPIIYDEPDNEMAVKVVKYATEYLNQLKKHELEEEKAKQKDISGGTTNKAVTELEQLWTLE